MSKTNAIDPNVPAGSEDPKLGDNRIRTLAAAIIEALAVNHYVGSDGGAGTGYNEDALGEHVIVVLRNTTAPSAETAKGKLYAISGELYYKDPDGNAIQLTNGGILNSANLTGDQTIAGTKTFSSQVSLTNGLTAAAALISTLATGTAPLTVASTTKVSNLNADKVDGYDVTAFTGQSSYTLPGGLVLKMGSATVGTSSDATATFPAAFDTECSKYWFNWKGASNSPNVNTNVICKSSSKTALVFRAINETCTVTWIAIGY